MAYELLHAGFDTLDVAFAGALPDESLHILEDAREQAAERHEPILIELGPRKVAMMVASYGMRGGYAFVVDTGPLGSLWRIKQNTDVREWNIFASPRATMLLAYGYRETRNRLLQELEAMGATIANHAINRVDFAMDFRTHDFSLKADQFVAHSHCKVQPHWGEKAPASDRNQPSAIVRGRRLESVTIGKMPGRQIIVYDKRREAIEKQKPYWFEAWGVSKGDPDLAVWRIEIRAGKKELKDRWNLRTFEDLEAGFGDVCHSALAQVRYTANEQTDSNISRQQLHPLWKAAENTVALDLMAFRAGLTPGQVKEIVRAQAIERYSTIVYSGSIGLAVALGMDDEAIAEELPTLASEWSALRMSNDSQRHQRALGRARKRLHFVD